MFVHQSRALEFVLFSSNPFIFINLVSIYASIHTHSTWIRIECIWQLTRKEVYVFIMLDQCDRYVIRKTIFFFVPYGAQTQLITHKRIALFRHFVVKSLSMPSYVTNSQPLSIINKLRFFVIYSMKNEASPSFVWRAYAYHSVSVSVAQGAPLHQDNITKPFIRANAVSF